MKKPDRFEREAYQLTTELYAQADNQSEKLSLGKIECACAIAIKLRKEHAWIVRNIQKHQWSINSFNDKELDERFKAGYSQACFEILNLLTQRKK